MEIYNDWKEILKEEQTKEYYQNLIDFIEEEYKTKQIYPEKEKIFNFLNLTSFESTKVVIIGQDPYHEKGQAHGLAFSVPNGEKTPPSLRNIFKEMKSDLGIDNEGCTDLTQLAKRGVLLMNTILTVEEGKALSHKNHGWERFTDAIISIINEKKTNVVFVLWGSDAIKKKRLIDQTKHLVLESSHPSPLSCYRGFLGSKHFSKINEYLKKTNQEEIDFNLKKEYNNL